MRSILAGLGVLTLALVAPAQEHEDRVLLADGKALLGRLVFEDASRLVLRQGARDVTLERARVQSVSSRRQALERLLGRAADVDLAKPEELELLAAEAEEAGLDEARAFWWRRLLLDHEHEPAHKALGHTRR